MGITLTIVNLFGTTPVLRDRLYMCSNGLIIEEEISCINLGHKLSAPGHLDGFNLYIRSISSYLSTKSNSSHQ